MVESSAGGSCRCQEGEFRGEEGGQCCGPQVFTSVLLGVLACVLMTGGVFLAFHRWDPLWLIVSGIGVVLVLIGSVLYCCAEFGRGRNTGVGVGGAKGGCCCPPAGPHLHGHLVANNGSLTEQLLPLSNARSVSQLSLNMLPGYFPPVVTTAYGIEQHSAVVQNINRLVQQQSPSVAGGQGGAQGGKSFILLSLPGGDTTQANVQNLVATVYQLEGSTATESPPPAEASSNNPLPAASPATSPPTTATTPRPVPVLFKSVEVQTCNVWLANSASGLANNNNSASSNTASASTSTETEDPRPSTSAVTTTSPVDLMDCDIPPPPPRICDSAARTQTCSGDQTAPLTNIPATPSSSSSVLVDVPAASSVLVDVPATPSSSSSVLVDVPAASSVLVDVPATSSPSSPSSVLVDVSESAAAVPADENLIHLAPPSEVPIETSRSVDAPRTSSDDVLIDISDSSGTSSEPSEIAASITPSSDSTCNLEEDTNGDLPSSNRLQQVGVASSELSLGNLSDFDGEVDDSELIGRSSPPPSYDDATHEGENAIGAFGLAYGTI